MATIPNEDTAPASVAPDGFTALTGTSNGRIVGDLDDGSYRGLWVKRIVTAGATAYGDDTCEIGTRGETTSI
jgi:hypothetical protein